MAKNGFMLAKYFLLDLHIILKSKGQKKKEKKEEKEVIIQTSDRPSLLLCEHDLLERCKIFTTINLTLPLYGGIKHLAKDII